MNVPGWRLWVAALGVASAGQGLAAAAMPNSAQATYNAAQVAFDKSDWAAAASGFGSLIPANANMPLNRSHAIIAGRLAEALLHLERFDEARSFGERAIAALPADDPNMPETLLVTADAARAGFDYAAAIGLYRRAIAAAEAAKQPHVAIDATAGLAITEATIDPKAAAQLLDPVLADPATKPTLIAKDLAVIEDLRARAAMNAGDTDTALKWITRAVNDSGGLGTQVNLSQVAIRNDAAIIYSLRHDDEDTRRLLAFTGAGHLKSIGWISSYDGDLPVCGGDGDVRPDDSVIVQFSIADDGHVMTALPIYASRPGLIGAAFAKAVSRWRWDPAALKGVDPFWRNALVLQLRCQTRPSPRGLQEPIVEKLGDWLAAQGVSTSGHLDSFVAEDDPRLAIDGPAAIPALLSRLWMNSKDADAVAARLRSILDADHAPAAGYALLIAASARDAGRHATDRKGFEHAVAAFYQDAVPAFASRYPDTPETGLLDLNWALALEELGDFEGAYPLLKRVAVIPQAALPDDSPIRQVAELHLAIAATRIGAPDAGRVLAKADINPDQCSLFDTHPIATSLAIGSDKFPVEAMRWGFEGYVEESYDIAADGRPADIRTIVAYPPFVFAESTESAVRAFRYVPPKIGDRLVGCAGETQRVNYRFPR